MESEKYKEELLKKKKKLEKELKKFDNSSIFTITRRFKILQVITFIEWYYKKL